jgi:hypothetical protein
MPARAATICRKAAESPGIPRDGRQPLSACGNICRTVNDALPAGVAHD